MVWQFEVCQCQFAFLFCHNPLIGCLIVRVFSCFPSLFALTIKKKLINKSTLTQTHMKIPVVKRMNTKNLQSRIALGQQQMFGSVGAHTHTHRSTPNTRTLKKENKQAEGVCWPRHGKKRTHKKDTVKSKKFNCNNFSFKWLPVVKVKI